MSDTNKPSNYPTKEYPEEDGETVMKKVTIIYSQSNENEKDLDDNLKITIEHQGAGFYFVMKTKRWAFNNIEELQQLLTDFKNKSGVI